MKVNWAATFSFRLLSRRTLLRWRRWRRAPGWCRRAARYNEREGDRREGLDAVRRRVQIGDEFDRSGAAAVVAGVAVVDEQIAAVAAGHRVDTAAAEDRVIAFIGLQVIASAGAGRHADPVISGPANTVLAPRRDVGGERIVALVAENDVVAAVGRDGSAGEAGDHDVVAEPGNHRVGAAVAEREVGAQAAHEGIAGIAAESLPPRMVWLPALVARTIVSA